MSRWRGTREPETVAEPDVVSNLGRYDVSATYRDSEGTHSWQVTCENLHVQPIELYDDYELLFTTDAQRPEVTDG